MADNLVPSVDEADNERSGYGSRSSSKWGPLKGPSHQDPKKKRDPASKITFSTLQATVWPKYKVGARAPPLDPSMFSLTLDIQFRPSLRITVPFLIIDLLVQYSRGCATPVEIILLILGITRPYLKRNLT